MEDTARSSWLEEHRDLFVKNIMRDFLQAYSVFLALEGSNPKQSVSHEELEGWVGKETDRGTLWRLKDECHRLWQDVDPAQHPEGFLFDWVVGAIFHEAVKLKENVYMMERYRPAYHLVIPATHPGGNGRPAETIDCPGFFEQTLTDIHSGIQRLACLFSRALQQAQCLLLRERDNTLLLRYILEERNRIDRILRDSGGLDQLLDVMFPEGLQRPYCMAGESYLEGSWYAEARLAFEEALRIDPWCTEAKTGLRILERRIKEIALIFEGKSPRARAGTATQEERARASLPEDQKGGKMAGDGCTE